MRVPRIVEEIRRSAMSLRYSIKEYTRLIISVSSLIEVV
jgi:hypothetical protein